VDNTEEFRCISLCTGYAGIEMGLRRVVPALRTVAYVEIEAFACANLVSKMEAGLLDATPIWTDIKTFPAQGFRNRVHIVTAGYPCQPFSVAGRRKGTDDPRHLWPHIERIIEAVRPVWFFGENVPGHLSIGFSEVYRSLRNLGYSVEAGLFTAAEVGAPHKRQRLFILANCSGERQLVRRMRTGNNNRLSKARNTSGTSSTLCIGNRWPSRPGQPQYEWEEPRVVEYAGSGTSKGLSQSEGRNLDREVGNADRQGQTQSGVGRATDGTASRVDRLRLLGNGVVPQQAELAFRCLAPRLALGVKGRR